MNELRKILVQARDIWKKISPAGRLGIIAALVVTVGVVAFVSLRGNVESYGTLFSGLAPDEAGRVIEELKTEKIPYKVTDGAVQVPEAKVMETRFLLAQKGLPRGGGVGNEIFDKQNFGATSFVEQMNARRAAEGELARTIMGLQEVESARVHLALPDKSLYLRTENPPSAAVSLKLRPGKKLTSGQVRGIVSFVANSIAGLGPERVTVIDEMGNVLSQSDDAQGALEAQLGMEKKLEQRVRDVLEKLVGPGHVEVVVTAEMDYAKTDSTKEQYGKEGTLRSESRTEEHAGGAIDPAGTGGVAGARGNLPGAPGPTTGANPGPTGGAGKISDTRNFEIDRTVTHTVGPTQQTKHLNVAVLVDQNDKAPRTPEELARMTALARAAVGFDKERGDTIEVHSAAFVVAPAEAEPPPVASTWPLPISPVLTAAAGGGLALVLITVLVLVMRAKAKKKKAAVLKTLPVRVGELDASTSAAAVKAGDLPGSATLPALPGKTPRELAHEAATADAERAARVVTAWLLES